MHYGYELKRVCLPIKVATVRIILKTYRKTVQRSQPHRTVSPYSQVIRRSVDLARDSSQLTCVLALNGLSALSNITALSYILHDKYPKPFSSFKFCTACWSNALSESLVRINMESHIKKPVIYGAYRNCISCQPQQVRFRCCSLLVMRMIVVGELIPVFSQTTRGEWRPQKMNLKGDMGEGLRYECFA